MNERIKIGIIGTGNISQFHIQSYLTNEKVELYAFCDINEKQLDIMAKKYGITRTFTDCRQMLALPELDAVSVCTWNSAHAPCVIEALNAGKHVLCEKPMAMSTEEALAMKEVADKSGKLLMIGFVRRFGNDCLILKDFVENGDLGEIYYSKATYLRRNGNPGGWFGDKSRSGGGPLIDLGVHVIDLTRYLMGNPKPVSVYGFTFQELLNRPGIKGSVDYESISKSENDICDVEDLAGAYVRYDNGAVLSIEASFSLNIKNDQGTIELMGTKGGAKLDPDLEIFTDLNGYLVDVGFNRPTAIDFDGIFKKEVDHFVDCVTDNVPCISPAGDGVQVMRIIDAIYTSAKTGHEVVLD